MPHHRPATFLLAALLGTSACKPDAPAARPPPAASAAKPPASGKPPTVKRLWMVPHPSEIMEVMRGMGLADKTAALCPVVKVDFAPLDGQRVAFNTGALVADLVLSLEGSKGGEVAARLDTIMQGLRELGMNPTQLADVDKLSKRLATGKVTPEELAGELDVLQGRLMDDVSQYSSQDALVGIQAGAWVRAVNVVATLLMQVGKATEGAHLFAQPALVDYFTNYLKKNTDKTVENPALEASLPHLKELKRIASKAELTAEDVPAVQQATAAILAQFQAKGGAP
ncbi:MAG: hypothetical protein HY904_02970 [Deltaproteobacteria bacterium]|nr:hypothetical protein [Deltaproteobacteria bacterium]